MKSMCFWCLKLHDRKKSVGVLYCSKKCQKAHDKFLNGVFG